MQHWLPTAVPEYSHAPAVPSRPAHIGGAARHCGRMVGRASGSSHATGYDILMSGRYVPPMEGMGEFTQTIRARRIGGCRK
ncbi:MAG: hypothetical protein WCB97_13535 [Thiobacillus sp.]